MDKKKEKETPLECIPVIVKSSELLWKLMDRIDGTVEYIIISSMMKGFKGEIEAKMYFKPKKTE